jgi:hypothetical protein
LVLQLAAYLGEKKVAMLVELLGLKVVVMLGLMTAVLMVEMKDAIWDLGRVALLVEKLDEQWASD